MSLSADGSRRLAAGIGLCVAGVAGSTLAAPWPDDVVPATTAIAIARLAFRPAEATIMVGDTVVWSNEDEFAHTTSADSGAWSSPELPVRGRYVYVAAHPGRFEYHCAAHPAMRGALNVVSRP